ncbi:MAG: helix-turn-helix transcriptional regulator, partial [Bacteroidales bacterium]
MAVENFKRLPVYVSRVTEHIYNEIDSYIQILEGISRLNNQSMSLVDFYKGEILFVSYNPLFLCGLT